MRERSRSSGRTHGSCSSKSGSKQLSAVPALSWPVGVWVAARMTFLRKMSLWMGLSPESPSLLNLIASSVNGGDRTHLTGLAEVTVSPQMLGEHSLRAGRCA